MKNKIFFLLGIIFLAVLISGCTQKIGDSFETPFAGAENFTDNPTAKCIDLCQQKLRGNVDLSNGPCLSNEISPNWVCDVAHDPRLNVDNLPENQCPAYNNGTAKHFVEVDTNCNLLRTH